MTPDKLVSDLFEGSSVAEPSAKLSFQQWVRDSARFRAFSESYQSKVRKKLRLARDSEGIDDVLAELRVAYRLLTNRAFEVSYEAGGVGEARRPDFAVTFKTHTLLHVEVKRVRPGVESEAAQADSEVSDEHLMPSEQRNASEEPHGKLARIVVSKIGQLLPQSPNVLVIVADQQPAFAAAFLSGMTQFQTRTARKDETLFRPYGYESASLFQRQYARLSGVVCLAEGGGTQAPSAEIWKNPNARHPLPADLARALRQVFTA